MEVLEERAITDAEAKDILEKKRKDAELKYEQKNALENLKKFTKIDFERVKVLVEELGKLNLRERQIIAIANFLPQDTDDLKVVLQKEYSNFKEDEITKILEAVKKI
jgi:DNA-directed RNA polymerase subunit F